MKYCSHCGAQIEDEAVVCVHCGYSTTETNVKPQNNNSLGKAALIFMIIACVAEPLTGVFQYLTAETVLTGIFNVGGGLISLAWCIPMTVYFSNKLKNGEQVGTGFKVCTLLFVNIIAGILMLCMPKNND